MLGDYKLLGQTYFINKQLPALLTNYMKKCEVQGQKSKLKDTL